MPGRTKEPQSYGSQADWTTGRTGEQPNDPKSEPRPEHRDFYDDARESEWSASYQGGMMSKETLDENVQPSGAPTGAYDPQRNVTNKEGGAKRTSYFRKRDYEGED